MGNKFINFIRKVWDNTRYWFLFCTLLFVGILVCFWVFKGVFSYSYVIRAEAYVRIIILLLAIIAFSLLRLYNSQVNNTRFLIKLREAIVKIEREFPGLERAMKDLKTSVNKNTTTVDSLDDTMSKLNSIGKSDGK